MNLGQNPINNSNKSLLAQKLFDPNSTITIAVDGPAASGKGHIAKLLAKKFNLEYVDSGAMYRIIAYKANQQKIDLSKTQMLEQFLSRFDFNISCNIAQKDLQSEDIGSKAAIISKYKIVRDKINEALREKINKTSRIIIDGRDIGTIIAPEADLKIYLTASEIIRANRRFKQLQDQQRECIMANILESIRLRDELDSNRDIAPLTIAEGAFIIDSSNLSPDEVIEEIVSLI